MKGQVWRAGNEQYHRKISQSVLLIEGENDKRKILVVIIKKNKMQRYSLIKFFSPSVCLVVPVEDALDLISMLKYGYLTVLKNGSHMVLIEKVEIVNKLIHLFLNDSFL